MKKFFKCQKHNNCKTNDSLLDSLDLDINSLINNDKQKDEIYLEKYINAFKDSFNISFTFGEDEDLYIDLFKYTSDGRLNCTITSYKNDRRDIYYFKYGQIDFYSFDTSNNEELNHVCYTDSEKISTIINKIIKLHANAHEIVSGKNYSIDVHSQL